MDTYNFEFFSETELMAGLWYGEARIVERDPIDELEEYLSIGTTVLNRKHSSRYPDTIKGVILQRNQFSCFNPDDPNAGKIFDFLMRGRENNLQYLTQRKQYATLMLYAGHCIAGRCIDFSRGADHYVARWLYEKPETENHPWIPKFKMTAIFGGHVFLRSPQMEQELKRAGNASHPCGGLT